MTLNWSTQKVKYFKENPDKLYSVYNANTPDEYEDLNAITKTLVFGTMIVGIGNLTYSTAPDFYARWKFYEHHDNLYLSKTYEDGEWKEILLTPEILVQHIGLSTNVSNLNDKEWLAKTIDSYKRTGDYTDMTAKTIKDFITNKKNEFEESFFLASK